MIHFGFEPKNLILSGYYLTLLITDLKLPERL